MEAVRFAVPELRDEVAQLIEEISLSEYEGFAVRTSAQIGKQGEALLERVGDGETSRPLCRCAAILLACTLSSC